MAKPTVIKGGKNGNGKHVSTFVNAKAMTLDAGEKAVKAWHGAYEEHKDLQEQIYANERAKNNTLTTLAIAFIKAAKNDPSINLRHAEGEEKVWSALKLKLEVAIGMRIVGVNEQGVEKYDLAPWTKGYLVQPGESRTTPEGKEKESFRTNFAHAMKKAAQNAFVIGEKNLTWREDKETGVLAISGPFVKEHFKADEVVLNQNRDQGPKMQDGKVKKLEVTPSFTELTKISKGLVGKSVQDRTDARLRSGAVLTQKEIADTVTRMTETIQKIKAPDDELAAALGKLADACKAALATKAA